MILLSWECPPRLNQAFDNNRSSGASIWNNPITRRSFLKRSGAATVGLLATVSLTKKAEAALYMDSQGEIHIQGSSDPNSPSNISPADCSHIYMTGNSAWAEVESKPFVMAGVQGFLIKYICQICGTVKYEFIPENLYIA